MKHQWLAYVVVGLLSIGAGVAIAGLPDNVPVDATIIPPATTDAPAPTVPETTVAPTTTVRPTTTLPSTTAPPTLPRTTVPATVAETIEADDSESAQLAERGELSVFVANGANVAGAALRAATRLEEAGYVDVQLRNGTTIFEFTTVYFAEGFEDAALRLAEDLDLLPDFVAPIQDAPTVIDLPAAVELLAYIGIDRA